MSNLVIVAIPEEMDRTWKISSEKVPHLTLLFLGDEANADTQQIVEFVEHAVTQSEHGQFYLDVDRRGTLGPDEADVLFFSKRSFNLKWIKQFRAQLLQNQAIRTAYDSTQQYEEWTPHLTLGYPPPGNPAKPLGPDDHPIYSVCFDRIAVWTTDFDGPEFQLEWPDRDLEGPLAVAYSDTQKAALTHYGSREALLEHHGVKGMKWGQRNVDSGVGGTSHTTKVALAGSLALLSPNLRKNTSSDTKLKVGLFGQYALLSGKVRADLKQASKKTDLQKGDSEWEKGLNDGHAWVAVQNKLADHFNQHIDSVNAKHASDKDWSNEPYDHPENSKDPQFRAYAKDVHALTKDSIQHASDSLHLENPSGTKKVKVDQDPNDPLTFRMSVEHVQHAATDSGEIEFKVKIETDSKGRATGFKIDEGADVNAVHGDIVSIAERGKAFIEHASVLDNPTISAQIKAKLQNILSDVTTDADGTVNLFGDPVLQAKIRSVLQDFYQDPNVDNAVVYSALGETIQHFGIKGMRWGFRRKEPPTAVAPKATSKVPHGDRRKTKIDTEGGQNHDAHPDALKVAESSAKLRKSGTKALSNHELAALAERARLEKAAVEADRHGANKWIRKFLGNQGNQAANQVVRTEVDSRIRSARNR
jgi:2'-5' RNA ligase